MKCSSYELEGNVDVYLDTDINEVNKTGEGKVTHPTHEIEGNVDVYLDTDINEVNKTGEGKVTHPTHEIEGNVDVYLDTDVNKVNKAREGKVTHPTHEIEGNVDVYLDTDVNKVNKTREGEVTHPPHETGKRRDVWLNKCTEEDLNDKNSKENQPCISTNGSSEKQENTMPLNETKVEIRESVNKFTFLLAKKIMEKYGIRCCNGKFFLYDKREGYFRK